MHDRRRREALIKRPAIAADRYICGGWEERLEPRGLSDIGHALGGEEGVAHLADHLHGPKIIHKLDPGQESGLWVR